MRSSIAGDTRTLVDVAEDAELRSDPLLDFRQEVLARSTYVDNIMMLLVNNEDDNLMTKLIIVA